MAARRKSAQRPRAGARPRPRSAPAAGAPRVKVRMYRQGLGDCFLLTFQPGTAAEAHLLIDLGTLGTQGTVTMPEVVADLRTTVGKRLRAVVATHEHADHLSGFPALLDAGVRADEAWMAWTEDPADPLARQVQKVQGDLLEATVRSAGALDDDRRRRAKERRARAGEDPVAAAADARGAALVDALDLGVRQLLRFHGLPPGAVEDREAAVGEGKSLSAHAGLKAEVQRMMGAVRDLAGGQVRCWSPGQAFERDWAPGVRFYVLGPPRDPAALRRLGDHGSPDLYELAKVVGVKLPASAYGAGDPEPETAWEPFDRIQMWPFGPQARALGPVVAAYEAEPWRQVDEGTAGAVADLALQLDNATNNTSLVLAIELGDQVLLFPGDAQLGSWRSWPEVAFEVGEGGARRRLLGAELLDRTRFYKVGHHGSHNATARSGLERMGGGGPLAAFIPLDERSARARHWPMPARKLLERLQEKTRGRVLKSDRDAEAAAFPGVKVDRLYVEATFPG